MTHEPYADIRRRPDGSIDSDFYTRRATLLRNEALRNDPASWLRNLSRLAGKGRRAAGLLLAGRPHTTRPLDT